MKIKLKRDLVIPAGTVLDCVDGESRDYNEGNYGQLVSLAPNTIGEIVIGTDKGFPYEYAFWFEEVE